MEMTVDQVISGHYVGQSIAIDYGDKPIDSIYSVGSYWIAPVVIEDGGMYTFPCDTHPLYPAVAGTVAVMPDPLDSVLQSIANAIADFNKPHIAANLAMQVLAEVRSPITTAALQHQLGNPDSGIHNSAIIDLTERRDAAGIAAARQIVANPSSPQKLRQSAALLLVHIPDPGALAFLETLLADQDRVVRAAGIMGLGELGTPPAIKLLGQALDDPDQSIRRLAVAGLATKLAQPNWGPGNPVLYYPSHEGMLVAYWKEWLQEHPEATSGGQ